MEQCISTMKLLTASPRTNLACILLLLPLKQGSAVFCLHSWRYSAPKQGLLSDLPYHSLSSSLRQVVIVSMDVASENLDSTRKLFKEQNPIPQNHTSTKSQGTMRSLTVPIILLLTSAIPALCHCPLQSIPDPTHDTIATLKNIQTPTLCQ